MTNENRIASMDAVGELPEMGNLLLREGGFPHLPDPAFVPAPKADAWNDAGTKPLKVGVYETNHDQFKHALCKHYQHWNGRFFGLVCRDIPNAIADKNEESGFQIVQWREVQP